MFDYFKALHLIFMVAWFAGLFYMPRLFIYDVEAESKEDGAREAVQQQLRMMSKRLWYIITWPGMILTVGFGTAMLMTQPVFLDQEYNANNGYFMYIKLGMVLGLVVYHLYCHKLFVQQQKGKLSWGSTALRMWNEIATLLLIAIVFVIVLRRGIDWIYGTVGLLAVAIAFMIVIKMYKRWREKRGQ